MKNTLELELDNVLAAMSRTSSTEDVQLQAARVLQELVNFPSLYDKYFGELVNVKKKSSLVTLIHRIRKE